MKSHLNLTARMQAIEPFHVMAILARERELQAQGKDIIHMEVGEPDFPTPAPIIEAGIKALQAGQTKYTAAQGIPELREAIANYYAQRFGVSLSPERILITPGASGALQLVLGVLLNPADEVLMTDPGYPCNRHFVRLYEGKAINIPVTAATRYQLTPTHISEYWSEATKAVLLATPANPTGTVLSQAELSALYERVNVYHGCLIVDEIYQGLSYGIKEVTALNVNDEHIWVVNSFSKFFGMTGWRLGWVVVPEYAIDRARRLAQNLFLSAPTPAQYAALAAFSPESLAIMEIQRQELQRRRDFLLPGLQTLGFNVHVQPQGAFYIYADCSALSADAYQFSINALEKAGVAITPGIDFGKYQANAHIRFAYTTSVERLAQALERLGQFLKS